MISVDHVKKILGDPTLSDQQVEEIRDGFHALCELIYEDWQEKQINKNKLNQKNDHTNITQQ